MSDFKMTKPAPPGFEYYMPVGGTEPWLRPIAAEEAPAPAEAPVLSGRLPEDFPGHTALEAAGITTYAKVRRVIDTLEDLDGIGTITAEKIREAMNAAPEDEGE